jgi:hypothetical protein
MDGHARSRARAEHALTASGLFPRTFVAVHPRPGRQPVYWILEASREPEPATEESLSMRSERGDRFSPAYEAVRQEMDCTP